MYKVRCNTRIVTMLDGVTFAYSVHIPEIIGIGRNRETSRRKCFEYIKVPLFLLEHNNVVVPNLGVETPPDDRNIAQRSSKNNCR